MFLSFPDFNLYSTPLLILVVQGYLFAVRCHILAYFSNTYRVQLNWLGLFLMVYCIALFGIQSALDIIDGQITDLHWQQGWWAFGALPGHQCRV